MVSAAIKYYSHEAVKKFTNRDGSTEPFFACKDVAAVQKLFEQEIYNFWGKALQRYIDFYNDIKNIKSYVDNQVTYNNFFPKIEEF